MAMGMGVVMMVAMASMLVESAQAQNGMVFAHYLIYQPVDISIYKQEIQLAQSKGIEAFALNTNVWRKNLADQMYQAAQELGSNFYLFFSADCHTDTDGTQLSISDIVAMIQTYSNHPNQLKYQGKQFFSAWLGDDDAWWQGKGQADAPTGWQTVFSQAGGRDNIFFVPFFSSADGSSVGNVDNVLNKFESVVDGLYAWDTSAWPCYSSPYTNPTDSRDLNFMTSSSSHGKVYMASVSPWFYNPYIGCSSVKCDYQGPNLWIQRWKQIITDQPPLVEIVTWNDWVESSYVSPQFSASGAAYNVTSFPHRAFLELGQHYINWYKAGGGSEPTPNGDSLYMFYYTNPAADGGCSILNSDQVFVVAMVASDAVIFVQSGSNSNTCNASAGVTVCSVNFSAGSQVATLTRNGVDVIPGGVTGAAAMGSTPNNYNVYSNCNNCQQ